MGSTGGEREHLHGVLRLDTHPTYRVQVVPVHCCRKCRPRHLHLNRNHAPFPSGDIVDLHTAQRGVPYPTKQVDLVAVHRSCMRPPVLHHFSRQHAPFFSGNVVHCHTLEIFSSPTKPTHHVNLAFVLHHSIVDGCACLRHGDREDAPRLGGKVVHLDTVQDGALCILPAHHVQLVFAHHHPV